MELVWLVYGISLLPKVGFVAFLMTFVGALLSVICWIGYASDEQIHKGFLWFITIVPIIGTLTLVVLPSEKTAYTMVAAYATQKVVERPEAQEAAKDVLTIINSKVKQYALESVKELEKATNK